MAEIKSKVDKVKRFVEIIGTDEFKESFSLCKEQVIHLLLKVFPKKWKLWMHYGFSDPATTGEALGVISIIYPFVIGHIAIEPDFDKAVFEEKFEAKGHIRLITILIIAIRMFLSKNIRKTIKILKK